MTKNYLKISLSANTKLISESTSESKPQIFTVSEINNLASSNLETNFSNILIKGECSGLSIEYASGFKYFTLKDTSSSLNVVINKSVYKNLNFDLENGLDLLISGKLTIYASKGAFQLIAQQVNLYGQGELELRFRQLKNKLLLEGLFAAENKKPLPQIFKNVALLTSDGSDAMHDIINTCFKRFPLNFYLLPIPVTGAKSAPSIAHAIEQINNYKEVQLDAIIIARGGGSAEDLWAFNEEVLVRAVYNSKIPIISAIGHNADISLVDLAADYDAKTPTGAGQFISQITLKEINEFLLKAQNIIKMISKQLIIKEKTQLNRLKEIIYYSLNQKNNNLLVKFNKITTEFQNNKSNLSHKFNYKLQTAKLILDQLLQHNFNRQEMRFKYFQENLARQKKTLINLSNKKGLALITKKNELDQLLIKKLQKYLLKINNYTLNISNISQTKIAFINLKLQNYSDLISNLNSLKILQKGYSLVFKQMDIIKSIKQINVQDEIRIQVSDGQFIARISKINPIE